MVVHPFLKDHCLNCHGARKQEGKLDLSVYSSTQAVVENYRSSWDLVLERLDAEEMPPEKAPRQPSWLTSRPGRHRVDRGGGARARP